MRRASGWWASMVQVLMMAALPAMAGKAADVADQLASRLISASPTVIAADDALMTRVNQLAEAAIETHCAACHGPELRGGPGVPDLTDYDWLWGITGFETTTAEPVMAIMQTILYGIRDTDCAEEVKSYGACPDTHYSEMPAYQELGFTDLQIDDLVEYVLNLSGREADPSAVMRAQALWPVCTECHGDDGWGYKPFGGPDLSNDIWLYGGERAQIRSVIADGRMGICPPHADVLDYATVKALAVYIYDRAFGL